MTTGPSDKLPPETVQGPNALPAADWLFAADAYRAIKACDAILVLNPLVKYRDGPSVSMEAHMTLLLIHLRSLLWQADKKGARINFRDDVAQEPKAQDVTDLIVKIRDAACHLNSGTNLVGASNRFAFVLVVGNQPNAIVMDGLALGCPYEDDVAIYYGSTRVFYRRHIERAFCEATRALAAELALFGYAPAY